MQLGGICEFSIMLQLTTSCAQIFHGISQCCLQFWSKVSKRQFVVPRNWWCWTTDFNIDLRHASSGKSNFACLIAHVFPTLRIIELSYRGGWLCIRGFWDLQTPNHQVWNPMILGVVSFRLRPADLYQKSRKWAGDIAKMGNNNTRRFPWQVTNLQCMI